MSMKRIAFFFLLMFSINLFSQTKIDSLENQLKIITENEKIAEMQTKYETEKKEQTIKIQELELQQNKAEQKRTRIIIISIL